MPFALTRKAMVVGVGGLLALLALAISNRSAAPPTSPNGNHPTSQTATPISRSPAHAKPIKIIPSAAIDERLFVLELLNELNASWPDENLPADQLQTALASLRQRATSIRNHLRDGRLDAKLTEAYDKFLGLLDAYTTYLNDIGRVEQAADARSEKEVSESGFNAGYGGAAAGFAVSDNGGTTTQSLAAAGLMALGTYLFDDYQKSKDREGAKRWATEAAQSKLKASVGEYLAFCRNTASALSGKYGWKQGEASFDESPEESATRAGLMRAGNTDGMAELKQTLQARRPRDPFLVRDKAYFRSLNANGPVAALVAAGNECLAAASLVPKERSTMITERSCFMWLAIFWIVHQTARSVARRGEVLSTRTQPWRRRCGRHGLATGRM